MHVTWWIYFVSLYEACLFLSELNELKNNGSSIRKLAVRFFPEIVAWSCNVLDLPIDGATLRSSFCYIGVKMIGYMLLSVANLWFIPND